jgi:hypothetical protein
MPAVSSGCGRSAWGLWALLTMDSEVVLPLAAGAVLILVILVGSVVVVLRPSYTPDRRP